MKETRALKPASLIVSANDYGGVSRDSQMAGVADKHPSFFHQSAFRDVVPRPCPSVSRMSLWLGSCRIQPVGIVCVLQALSRFSAGANTLQVL